MASFAEKSSPDPYLSTTIDDEFAIEEKLGSGGMGTVYRAIQQLTERSVALKLLHAHLCDESMTMRFRKEAQIISRLSHPNIVTVYKYGQHSDGPLYLAMEYLQGQGLDALLGAERRMDLDRALPLMVQMADALAYAHEQKVIHRDIKPENMMVIRAGRSESVKILDFGIAKMVDGNSTLTKSGMLCGSPPYMAPEQWQEVRDIDGRTDIYALGCVFYELLTGEQPFQANSVVGYMRAHMHGPRPPPPLEAGARIGALPAISDIIMKCLARDRVERFPDGYSLVEALKEQQLELDTSRLARGGPASVRRYARAVAVTQVAGDLPREASELPSTPADLASVEAAPSSTPPASVDPGRRSGPPASVEAARSSMPPASVDPGRRSAPPAVVDEALRGEGGAASENDETRDLLREVAQTFPRRAEVDEPDAVDAQQAARMHAVVVATGSVLCLALALALVWLR